LTDRIDITGIEVYAKHGVLDEEQERAQVFKVDVTVFTELAAAGSSDDLADTIDYGALALEVREVVGSESHKLLEKVAAQVCEAVMAHPGVDRSIVTIHKPFAPIDLVFEDVSVTVERSR
jgi:dihydroneopterin aldolase/2-amino-4-hydroxy-6-hydroxymethyldihydropteridine diphosphokinase